MQKRFCGSGNTGLRFGSCILCTALSTINQIAMAALAQSEGLKWKAGLSINSSITLAFQKIESSDDEMAALKIQRP
ncbi:hypothetical protein [Pedobacter sp. ASV28]|uniref:hypothetical protein n=1 Tax=Pedobacter sp. ASV28 TaxID=2795123 RepID=UPI001E49BA7D|nr:hypothetical protein [Pedobacter sp. ASV28]